MACAHTNDCPLFPKLHASLAAWREFYCDTESAWTTCARYERAVRGQAVPIALLPNGKIVGMVAEHEHDAPGQDATDGSTPGVIRDASQLPTEIKPSLWRRQSPSIGQMPGGGTKGSPPGARA